MGKFKIGDRVSFVERFTNRRVKGTIRKHEASDSVLVDLDCGHCNRFVDSVDCSPVKPKAKKVEHVHDEVLCPVPPEHSNPVVLKYSCPVAGCDWGKTEDSSKVCQRCGHDRIAHIHEEGACRPGWVCEFKCQRYEPRGGSSPAPRTKPREWWLLGYSGMETRMALDKRPADHTLVDGFSVIHVREVIE